MWWCNGFILYSEMPVCRRRVTSYGGEHLFHLGIFDFVAVLGVEVH